MTKVCGRDSMRPVSRAGFRIKQWELPYSRAFSGCCGLLLQESCTDTNSTFAFDWCNKLLSLFLLKDLPWIWVHFHFGSGNTTCQFLFIGYILAVIKYFQNIFLFIDRKFSDVFSSERLYFFCWWSYLYCLCLKNTKCQKKYKSKLFYLPIYIFHGLQ